MCGGDLQVASRADVQIDAEIGQKDHFRTETHEEGEAMAVVTISRQFGAGGRTLAERVAKELGYRYVHEDMIKEIAIKAQVSHDQIKSFEKRGTDKLMKFLDKIVSTSYVERLCADNYGYVDEKSYVDAVKDTILGFYEKGEVVLVGRGGQFILEKHAGAVHILLVGDVPSRIHFLVTQYGLKQEDAEKAMRRADDIRNRFLNFYAEPERHNDPLSYDLTINTGRVSMDAAVDLIVGLARKKV
ncbi:putative Cytidylate kinase-like family [uncultured Desulfatiglans sp.]|nr:putative Cytidylate kinase-like family [uncultured Desulfatiglans sp.]